MKIKKYYLEFINMLKQFFCVDNKQQNIYLMIFLFFTLNKFIFDSNIFIYLGFISVIVYNIYLYKNHKYENLTTIMISILTYSLILPDNYTIILISIIIFICVLPTYIRKNNLINIKNEIIIVSIFLFINILLNKIGIIKIGFALLFNITFFIYYILFKNSNTFKINRNFIENDLINIVIIQVFATLLNILLNFNNILQDFAGDWSVGTFGEQQGNILIITMAFLAIRYINMYIENKVPKYMVLFSMCLLVAMTTFSLVNIIVLVFVLVINIITKITLKNGKKGIFKYLVAIFSVIIILYSVSPRWVKNDISNFTNISYIKYRVRKINTYEDTFVNIPKRDIKFLLIGNGVGNYSSRAALTTTGKYIGAYNKLFKPKISEYTNTVILENLYSEHALNNPAIYASVLGTPLSTYITIMGEFGIIGMILFLIGIIKIFKNININQKFLLIYFLLICLFDNWIEFSKVVLILWMTIYLLRQPEEEN